MAPEDPFSQSFTLLQADGTPFSVNLADLHAFELYNIRICINYGCQIGASLLLLLVLLLVTNPDKRRAPIFIINILSLAFNFIRLLLLSLYFTGGFTEPYAFFAGDWSRVSPSDYANSVAAVVFTLLVLLCVEASLMMQVAVVCATMKSLYRRGLLAACAMVASVAIGFRAALVVQNIKSIVRTEASETWKWMVLATNVTTTISICIFCALFAVKLGIAMRERRKLHLRQYGPMRILFIMGCQTMLVPGKSASSRMTPAGAFCS
jgi:pheromone alpha factor receptor